MSDTTRSQNEPPMAHRTSALLVAAAWLFVGIPAAWGVSQTFRQAMKLFQRGTPAAVTPATNQAAR